MSKKIYASEYENYPSCGGDYLELEKFPTYENTEFSEKPISEILENIINKPKHYNQGKYQPIHVIEDWKVPYHLGNVLKYISRAKYKNNEIEDLEKARWYLDRYIHLLKENV